jgi:ADP-dependent NAD(P)H-hydrate dehydratase / NAD(P)H-hydrate epimerase
MLVTCSEMSEAERLFFSGDRSPEPWMDEAGRLCAAAILDFFPSAARAKVFCGRGNNGGDALVVARWLKREGWWVEVILSDGVEGLSPLARKKFAEWEEEPLPSRSCIGVEGRPLVLLDGLVGIGAKGELRGTLRDLAAAMNALRRRESGTTFAIDLPSGFDADLGVAGPSAVVADVTLAITAAKTGFVADGAENTVGRIVEIPLEIPLASGDASRRCLFPSNLRPRLPRRDFNTHKGDAGRVVIVAGSKGLTGASLLSALGASHGGAGLVTVCVPEEIYPIVAAKAPPEVMVRSYCEASEIRGLSADVFAVGPGLGAALLPGIEEILIEEPRPLVIDADALNALARRPGGIPPFAGPRLLTPHPGEMARLIGGPTDESRAALARRFAEDHGITLLLKGARTVIASPGRPLEFNTTGHPGMASGGMGDVLTGLCAALIGQGLDPHDAACLGSWLLGRAAELAKRDLGMAAESVTAPLVADRIGSALLALQTPGTP